jgi:hypothetical protein
MNRIEETFDVDTIQHYNNEFETRLKRDGEDVVGRPVYAGDELDLNGPVTVSLGEYFTVIEGDMKITVSWVEREYEGEPYTEDHRVEQIEVFK